MLKFEIKKIFSKVTNKIAVLILFGVLAVTCFMAVQSVNYVDENGDSHSGIRAARQLRDVKNDWAGDITETKLIDMIKENEIINASSEYLSSNVKDNDKAYSRKQGFMDLRELISRAFSGFQEYDYFRADRVSADEVGMFYEKRIDILEEWLNTVAKDQFSENEKLFLITCYQGLETPLYYEYADGWKALLEFSPTMIMLLVLVTSFMVTGIFSSEFQLKADAVFFSTKLGRNKAVKSKVYAGFCVVTGLYWSLMLLYTVIVLGSLGMDGANCMIQTESGGFKSLYVITFWQEYLLTLFGGYLGSLFILTLSMLVSALTHSAILAVTVPFILLFIPSFLSGISVMSKVLGVLPDQLLQMNMAVKYFNLYQIGDKVVGAIPVLLLVYLILYILMCPLLYQVYRRAQLK